MKIEAGNRAGMKRIGETGFTLLQHTFYLFQVIIKYAFLLVLLFLLASHESANPELGNTTFEFYSSEFRSALLIDENRQESGNKTGLSESQLKALFFEKRQYMPAWTYNFELQSSFNE
jgi:hypothetical protein